MALSIAPTLHAVEVTSGDNIRGGNVNLQGLGSTLADLENRVSSSTARLFKIKECHEKGQFFAKLADGTEGCKNVIPTECTLPWGGTIREGQGVLAFATPSVPEGYTCSAEARYCQNGGLTGSYRYGNCRVELPAVVVVPPSR